MYSSQYEMESGSVKSSVCIVICAERAKRAKRVCIFDGLRLLVGAVLVVVVGW